MRRPSLGARLLKHWFLCVVLCALAGTTALIVWWLIPPSDVGRYAKGAPGDWAKLRNEQAERGARKRPRVPYVPLTSVPVDLQLAVLAGEDIGYFGHGPWDLEAIREALDDWWERGRLRGASTITQQLAKNLFLSEDRSVLRKLREARYAYWLERKLGKRRIFELYLNIIELGNNVYGVEAAARHYFGVSAAELSAEQAAELAATIPSPLKHNPSTRTHAWQARYDAIRERMEHYGDIRALLSASHGGRRQQ